MIREGVMISGRYEIMGRIGTGGMADVYKGIDRTLNRYVAIKVLKREFREDETFVKKFRTEAQSAAGLTHPNIVNVYDVGEDRGLYYIVMELVEGITLKDYIQKKGRLTPKEVISIGVQVCSAMEMAHSHNIIHRDIKPQNIMISKEGKIKVTDFGIAKATSSNTISTNVMGSVHYTSPEQARGGYSDAKSDIYSLGITMYEMITGRLPFDGDSTVSIALKHLQEDMVEPSELVKDIPYSLEQIILKCTQKSPARRYANTALLEKDLRRSLVEPDGDFVVIAPFNASETKMVTAEELAMIQQAAADSEYDDCDDDDYEERRARRNNSKKGVDPKVAKIMKILGVVAAIIIALVMLLLLKGCAEMLPGMLGSNNNTQTEKEKGNVEVPKLVGLTKEEAEKACKKVGLKLKVIKEENSTEYEEGYVMEQRSQEGAKLAEGAYVQVVVSKGKLIEMPDLSKEEYIEARDVLIDLGFDKANIKKEEEPHAEIAEGEVTRTDPVTGSLVSKDTKITIYVSTGIEMVEIPNLVGKTKEDAQKLLEEAGLVGNVTEEYSTEQAGRVIDQKATAGEEIAKGSTIDYTVSKGEKPKEKVVVPAGLKGKSYSSVEATLRNLGLYPSPTYDESADVKKGCVIYIEGEGLEVEEGSTIIVVVSTGSTAGSDTTTP